MDYNLNHKNYINDSINNSGSNKIKKEESSTEKKDDDPKKFNLPKISENLYNKVEDSYPSNTINSAEVYKAYNYSLNELKSKSKYYKKEDLLKRANFYFSLYHRINCSPINQYYNFNKYNQINRNSFCINF
jgi:hypothetical protein